MANYNSYDSFIEKSSNFVTNQRGLFIAINIISAIFHGGMSVTFAYMDELAGLYICLGVGSAVLIASLIMIFLLTKNNHNHFNGQKDFKNLLPNPEAMQQFQKFMTYYNNSLSDDVKDKKLLRELIRESIIGSVYRKKSINIYLSVDSSDLDINIIYKDTILSILNDLSDKVNFTSKSDDKFVYLYLFRRKTEINNHLDKEKLFLNLSSKISKLLIIENRSSDNFDLNFRLCNEILEILSVKVLLYRNVNFEIREENIEFNSTNELPKLYIHFRNEKSIEKKLIDDFILQDLDSEKLDYYVTDK